MLASHIDQSLPHNEAAERCVLGCLLLGERVRGGQALGADAFFVGAHRLIWAAIESAGEEVDEARVADHLRVQGRLDAIGGLGALVALTDAAPNAGRLTHYVKILHTNSLRRALILAAQQIRDAAASETDFDEARKRAERLMFGVASGRSKAELTPMKAIVPGALNTLQAGLEAGRGMMGLSTGYAALDAVTNGLSPGDLVVLAARPGMGKTALALNMAQRMAVRGVCHVAFFSLEMDSRQLGLRMMSSEARVNSKNVRRGGMSTAEWSRLTIAAGRLSEMPIFIDDTGGISMVELRAKIRQLHVSQRIHAVFVDYLQLISGRAGKDGREREIAEISRSLKAMAKDLGVPVVVLSQLNRNAEKRDGRRPVLSDLRESGAIEQDADMVWFVYREAYYDKESDYPRDADVIVAKNRNGPTDTVRLAFDGEFMRFSDGVH